MSARTGVEGDEETMLNILSPTRLSSFDVIDFGACGYDDGASDSTLDEFIIPDWVRLFSP